MSTPAGKGTAPRQQRDDEAYSQGWDRIFKKKQEWLPDDFHAVHERIEKDAGIHHSQQCERPESCSEPFCQCEVKDEPDNT